jgi:exopolysaccharide biosynthesis protein
VRRLVEASGAIVGINANFFDTEGRALGLVVSDGVVRQRLHGGGRTLTGVFAIDKNGPKIEGRIAYAPAGVTEAVQAGPRLIVNGVPSTGLSTSGASSRRAGVCVDDAGRVLLFAVSSGLLGLTLQEFQNLLMQRDLKCRDALNLDGGGSVQLSVVPGVVPGGLKTAEIFIPGADEVPVMLGLFPLKSP